MTAITEPSSHLSPYLRELVAKLPGDDAPPVEPPPALKERIMAVVRAEARAADLASEPVELPASVSSAGAPGAGATLTLMGAGATLRAWGLPAPPAGCVYRVWLLRGPAPRVPEPGPLLTLDATGGGAVELGALAGAEELTLALEGSGAVPLASPALRVGIPPGVRTRRGR